MIIFLGLWPECITAGADIYNPANTTHRSNVGRILGQRRRRWANIGSTFDRCAVFSGNVHDVTKIK